MIIVEDIKFKTKRMGVLFENIRFRRTSQPAKLINWPNHYYQINSKCVQYSYMVHEKITRFAFENKKRLIFQNVLTFKVLYSLSENIAFAHPKILTIRFN